MASTVAERRRAATRSPERVWPARDPERGPAGGSQQLRIERVRVLPLLVFPEVLAVIGRYDHDRLVEHPAPSGVEQGPEVVIEEASDSLRVQFALHL
ncbi:MAG: hypothetical protein IPK33_25645 [Gemmatimonadetes bacterium]|nr:hypothetical protein [Gemmatimonadota bacterium]